MACAILLVSGLNDRILVVHAIMAQRSEGAESLARYS